MEKQKLIKILLNASELEESHTPTITNFFLEDFDWLGIEEDKVNRIKEILKLIRTQTMEHERILNELIGKIQDSEENEF